MCSKRWVKKKSLAKVTQIFKTIDTKGLKYITCDQFVEYIINKRKLKVEKLNPSEPKSITKTTTRSQKKAADKKNEKVENKTLPQMPILTKSAITSNNTSETPNLQKGLSLADFYTQFAGLHDEITAESIDENRNPVGREYDLGIEGAFNLFSIIIIFFQTCFHGYSTCLEEALRSKGFKVTVANAIPEFLSQLHEHDQAWVVSSGLNINEHSEFVQEIVKFHESGKGIFIWSDNEPLFVEANSILDKILPGVKLIGNTGADKILQPESSNANGLQPTKGHFARHLITTGIVSLYEGVTISYPNKILPQMTVIGQSTDNNPCFFCVEPKGKGRIMVDCGYTKLYDYTWNKTAGTERYVRNCAVWLLGLESRIKTNAPLRGDVRVLESNTTT